MTVEPPWTTHLTASIKDGIAAGAFVKVNVKETVEVLMRMLLGLLDMAQAPKTIRKTLITFIERGLVQTK